ncbi:MAG: HNH endonuclease [Calditrichaeota bacterium]|nr:MAG: HNH endonuclease [Calditrichota bacterium]
MLNKSVLILNQNYEPITVCNVKKAIILIYLGKAEIIERRPQWVHSVSFQLPLPSVIRLMVFVKVPRKKVLLNRKNLLIRDHFTCQYCGRRTHPLTIDHVIPRQYGGKDTWENLVVACLPCNNRKANRTPEQAGMKLINQPRRPNHFFYIQHFIGVKEESWRPYLFMS